MRRPGSSARRQPAEEAAAEAEYATIEEIPICPIEDPVREAPAYSSAPAAPAAPAAHAAANHGRLCTNCRATELLNEAPARNPYDEQELKDTAARIKSKFQEFNVLGNVVQINPGPVVTTFEFKPEAGIKYSRITTLNEDLCLGLQAESILIERIPGKPTVGIEVPNSRRELIALRQMLESDEFAAIAFAADHPAGQGHQRAHPRGGAGFHAAPADRRLDGSGKSVMLNSMIMSILYKATPDEVRMIMVDPKRLELGLVRGHPAPADAGDHGPQEGHQRAAQRGAGDGAAAAAAGRVRRAQHRAVQQEDPQAAGRAAQPVRRQEEAAEEELRPLPYILILIDELADLMMLEGRNVEESVTRLAQMARAVGMHLVLATQRPSVDVITGLIKANFPARISFRVATRVDSRTILDVMGAEHLLGKGDMLFLPPGSSRLTRMHGAFVTETEINRVVEFWKGQAAAGVRPIVPDGAARPRTTKRLRKARRRATIRTPCTRRPCGWCCKWARRPPRPCSATCGWATAARRASWT